MKDNIPHSDGLHRLSRLLTVFFICLAAAGFSAPAGAEQTLADADWFERELADGVVWRFYLFDDLFGSVQSISYLDVDLTNPSVSVEIPYLESTREGTSSMIPSQFPSAVAGMNGSYFDTSSTGGHRTYLRIDGTEVPPGGALFPPWGYEGGYALNASGDSSIIEKPSGGWSVNTTHPDILACGPLLIVSGVIPSDDLTAIGSHCTSRHPRSAVGLTPGDHLILLTVDGRTELSSGMTCEETAQILEDLGCDEGLNMDGGGSTTLWGAGELYDGVLNYPSDNGLYDHEGERSCSNAIAVISGPAAPQSWDARLTAKNYSQSMENSSQQTVSLVYKNIGTETWTAANTTVILARPETRTSTFYDSATWPSQSQPATMTPATVAPGESGTFSFVMISPDAAVTTVYDEHFMLTQNGVGRIGPADSEAWMRITIQPPVAPETTFIVESRPGGHNSAWYSDSGMANSGTNCTAPGCVGTIGTRYGSTYRSVAGSKNATVAPDFPGSGCYNVYVSWGAGSSRRSPVTYHVNHSGGTDTFQLDQTATANEWIQLGSEPYFFEKGLSGTVVMTNEDIDVSGSMFAGGVMFEYVAPDKSYEVNFLGPGDDTPVIDGQVDSGEWDAASVAGTGFVRHDSPSTAAAEDGSFKMLFDDTYLYILFEMADAYLPGYATPPASYDYFDLAGDKINFFFTPLGVGGDPFYRILLSPNPTDGVCYIWSQASVERNTSASAGTDWVATGNAAYTYASGDLTIEYRIAWAEFDYPGMSVSTSPEDGAVWGVQPCISNEVTNGNWEYVNWEPDDTPSYIYGSPLGAMAFVKDSTGVSSWAMY